jgi:DNA-directed RNA polymerase subunit RPC12/RpoP
MSADTTPVDDRTPERPADPHGIIPESFWEHYDSLREAEQAPSTSDTAAEERCPECLSARVRLKQDSLREQPNREPENWKCLNCSEHFDQPYNAAADFPACPGCGRRRYVREHDSGKFHCQGCVKTFDLDWHEMRVPHDERGFAFDPEEGEQIELGEVE